MNQYELSPALKSEILEALDRLYSKRELSNILATEHFNYTRKKTESAVDVSLSEKSYSDYMFFNQSKSVIAQQVVYIMSKHRQCSEDRKLLFLDTLGIHLLNLDRLRIAKMGDAIRECDWLLTRSGIAHIARNFDDQLGARVHSCDDLDGFDFEFDYQLSSGEGRLQFSNSNQSVIDVSLSGGDEQLERRWMEIGKEQLQNALSHEMKAAPELISQRGEPEPGMTP